MLDTGLMKAVTETYVFDSLTFTEAESKTLEETSTFVSGDFTIKTITPAQYKEIFFSDDAKADKWYKARLQFITYDEKTEKEKKENIYYLVQAKDFTGAVDTIVEAMRQTMIDYSIFSVTETPILDVFCSNNN